MRVGIISKEEHCKPHAKAIRGAGHDVKLLGGGPAVDVSPSIDVLVCRTVSCAHSADATARSVQREGRIPVIFEDSVTRIMAALTKLTDMEKPVSKNTARKLFETYLRGGGIAWMSLPRETVEGKVTPTDFCTLSKRATSALDTLANKSDSSRRRAIKELAASGRFEVNMLWKNTPEGRGHRQIETPVLSADPLDFDKLASVCLYGGFSRSRDEPEPVTGFHHEARPEEHGWLVYRTGHPVPLDGPLLSRDQAVEAVLLLDEAIEDAKAPVPLGVAYLVLRGLFNGKANTALVKFARISEPIGHLWKPSLLAARDASDEHFSGVKDKRRTPFKRLEDGTVLVGRSLNNAKHSRRLATMKEERPDYFEWLSFEDFANSRGEQVRRKAEAVKVEEPEPNPEPVEPKGAPVPAPAPAPVRDIPALAQQLLEAMQEQGIENLQHGPLEVTFRSLHLVDQDGNSACKTEGLTTTSLGMVTCKRCRTTRLYKSAEYALSKLMA